ncbi:hypothetical protein WK12_11710 [Burkholderia ubonensis]|nr:hypothetical protein WK12_11710 [Burkholderia ubonensis]
MILLWVTCTVVFLISTRSSPSSAMTRRAIGFLALAIWSIAAQNRLPFSMQYTDIASKRSEATTKT